MPEKKKKSVQAHYAEDKAILELKQAMGLGIDVELAVGDQLDFPFLETFRIKINPLLLIVLWIHILSSKV